MQMKLLLLLNLASIAFLPVMAQSPVDAEKNLVTKSVILPAAKKPIANYVTSVRVGNLLFLSGHGHCGAAFSGGYR